MKKVGIVTFHYVDNFGAVLQCYSLQKVMNNFEGVHAEIIDYRPADFKYDRVWKNEKERKLFLEKRKKFEKFLIHYCNMSAKRVSAIDGKGYDYCCVGSDQIWNPMFSYEEYFLPHIMRETTKIAYAASVGCSISELAPYKKFFSKYLSKFKTISVREREHAEYISRISGKFCQSVLDPTLLLGKEEFLSLFRDKKENSEKPYVLFYWLFHDQELLRGVELVNTIARKYDLQVIHSVFGADGFMFCKEAHCMYYCGIEEFLWYIKNAAFLVTNSYHGTIFALHFEVPFYTFVVDSMKSRFDTLLDYVDFGDRIVTQTIPEKEISRNIEYKRMKEDISEYRDKSLAFLREALSIEQ